ncbi:hypothetical protein VPH35_132044 [Triticum aestivum]
MEKPVKVPMSRLTDDLIAEILSRVPYKSLCICKCVCPAWRDLIADPAHRKKVVQTLAGFFYRITGEVTAVKYADLSAFPWSSVPKTYPRLPLPTDNNFFSLEDSCDGLFLARIRTGTPAGKFRYMVSNPATNEYTVLPDSGSAGNICLAYLGFDSDVSTQEFHVFEFVLVLREPSLVVRGVNIYSSKTVAWVAMEPKWDIQVTLCWRKPGVFRKGFLHLLIGQFGLAILDAEGLTWRIIPLPVVESVNPCFSGFIGKSAGQLIYIDRGAIEGHGSNALLTISVYVLGAEICQWDVTHLDDKCMRWKLLHKLSNVLRRRCFGSLIGRMNWLHTIWIVMRSTIVYHIHIEPNYWQFMNFFPYVPSLSRLPLDGGIQLATPNQ